MKQYDVVPNPFRRAMPNVPFLLVLQHDRNTDSPRVLVAPLSSSAKSSRRDVELTVSGKRYVLLPLDLSPVERDFLTRPPVANLAHDSYAIQTALDIVFSAAG